MITDKANQTVAYQKVPSRFPNKNMNIGGQISNQRNTVPSPPHM